MDVTGQAYPSIKELEAVQKLFHDAWPKLEPPPIESCYNMFVRMEILRKRKGTPAKARAEAKKFIEAGRNFLRVMAETKKRHESTLDAFGLLEPLAIEAIGPDPTLHHMDHAKSHVESLLDLYKENRPDPALFLADGAKDVWKTLNARASMSRKPDDPLCIFTVSALEKCGIHTSRHTVSDMLRGRARRPRSGKPRVEGGRKTSQKLPD